MPEKAVVYENSKAGTAYVVESKLKVMLEQDYLALSHNVIPAKAGIHSKCNVIPAKAGIHSKSNVIPAKAGIHSKTNVIPAKAGIHS